MDEPFSTLHFLFSGLANVRYLVIYYGIFCLIALWAIFEKAYEPGWGALIPIYNSYQYFKITWGNGWYFLLLLIPFVNVIIAIITTFKLARSFGKSGGFAVGLIFLSVIFYCILAFDQSQYLGVPENA